jgi:hypothetical protein
MSLVVDSYRFAPPTGEPKGLTYLAAASNANDLSTYTFASQSLGASASNRTILIGVHGRASGGTAYTIDSVTVAGESADPVVALFQFGTNSLVAALYAVDLPTGTTGDVVVTFSRAQLRAAIGLWRATDIDYAAPHDTGSSSANSPTDTLNVVAGGFAIGVASVGAGVTWTNLDEDYDLTVETFFGATGASIDTPSTTSTTFTASGSASGEESGVFASW